jgi:hypothetical protein
MARIIKPPKDVMSFLETLEKLFGEDYKKGETSEDNMVMLRGKAKVW